MEDCDVLVIGGGPAGSTAAALLAAQGRHVVLAERDVHPRFHIGESLLPRNLRLLDLLGVRDQVAETGVFKPGAEFVSDHCGRHVAFPFSQALDKRYTYAYQVRRADFDDILFRNAAQRGAAVLERAQVTDVVPAEAGRRGRVSVQVDGAARDFAPRFVLDASGRDTFMAGRLRLKQSDKHNSTAAVFAHFRGIAPLTSETTGYITIHLVDDGWFWMIPLPDGIMSVGFVGNQSAFKSRQGSAADLFMARLRESPSVQARMRHAVLASEIHSAGNYSYRASRAWGEGWFMIGDAFAFLDPVFSSGVLLAMTAGELGAGVADRWLQDPLAGRAAARRAERQLRREMDSIGWLIQRINTPVLRSMFMAPNNTLRMRDGLVSMLGGNLHGNWRSRLPVLAFKSVYYVMKLADRAGYPLLPAPAV